MTNKLKKLMQFLFVQRVQYIPDHSVHIHTFMKDTYTRIGEGME